MIRKTQRLNERGPAIKLRSEINKLWDTVESLRIASGVGYRVKRTRNGTALEIKTRAGTVEGEFEVERMHVYSVADELLTCYKVTSDGTSYYGSAIDVLKPYQTRINDPESLPIIENSPEITISQPVGNNFQRRTLTWAYAGEEFSIDQYISPSYSTGGGTTGFRNWIFAARPINNFSAENANGDAVTWVDLNVSGRHWSCNDFVRVEVCVNNVTKHMYVPASSVGVAG